MAIAVVTDHHLGYHLQIFDAPEDIGVSDVIGWCKRKLSYVNLIQDYIEISISRNLCKNCYAQEFHVLQNGAKKPTPHKIYVFETLSYK
jgi:hypothetical protein